MQAMVLESPGSGLVEREWPIPEPGPGEILLRVKACGVCRTDLHVVDGELPQKHLPIVPGHEIVGTIEKLGAGSTGLSVGQKVGVPWLAETCGNCRYCLEEKENLCDSAVFTGYMRNGGYAQYTIANADFCIPLPDECSDVTTAPLLCAGLIGWRSLNFAGKARSLGLYGFGAAAHIVIQLARHQGRRVFAFTRPGDEKGQEFAKSLGAEWSGGSDQAPPEFLDAAIIFAPVGSLVPTALKSTRKGGIVVCAGIHMSDIPSFPYEIIWAERSIVSVANLTRQDANNFFATIQTLQIETTVKRYQLSQANTALDDLRSGRIKGAAVLVPGQ